LPLLIRCFSLLLFTLTLHVPGWTQTDQPAAPPAQNPAAPATAQTDLDDVDDPVSNIPLPEAKTVLVKNRKIVYYEEGQGSTVILLHGLGADSRHWAANLGPLSSSFHVLTLDQIGYGKSDKPLMRYTVANFAEYLGGFMDALSIPKATLVGNSLGGWIALDFTIRHPDRVEKLVLVDAAGLHPVEPLRLPEGGWKDLTPGTTHWFFDLMAANKSWATTDLGPHGFERHVKNGDSYTVASSVAEMVVGHEFEDKKLENVDTPTLIIWGRDDVLIPLAMGEKFHKGIAGSQLVVIEGTGHIPMVGKPDEFNQLVKNFVSSTPQPAAR
jgi:pimeloyl-ACP methyl ester carboxylesterase